MNVFFIASRKQRLELMRYPFIRAVATASVQAHPFSAVI